MSKTALLPYRPSKFGESSLAHAYDAFRLRCRAQNLSPATCAWYHANIRSWHRFIEAHDKAVLETMAEIERHCAGTQPRAGQHEKTGNLAYVTVRDGFNRDHDPHLHTHVVVPNMTAYKDRILALDGKQIMTRDFNKLWGAMYRAKLVIVDEASMLDSRGLAELMRSAARAGDKIVLVGDRNQLQSVGAGKPFERRVEAAKEYGSNTLILTGTRAGRDALNGLIRARLMERGALVPETSRRYELERPDEDGVTRAVERDLAVGDRVTFLKNEYKDYDVRNGELGTVTRAAEGGVGIRLDDGREVSIDLRRYAAIDHGYALTTYKSQGQTYDRVVVDADTRSGDRGVVQVQVDRRSAHEYDLLLEASQEDMLRAQRHSACQALGDRGRSHEETRGVRPPDCRRWERLVLRGHR